MKERSKTGRLRWWAWAWNLQKFRDETSSKGAKDTLFLNSPNDWSLSDVTRWSWRWSDRSPTSKSRRFKRSDSDSMVRRRSFKSTTQLIWRSTFDFILNPIHHRFRSLLSSSLIQFIHQSIVPWGTSRNAGSKRTVVREVAASRWISCTITFRFLRLPFGGCYSILQSDQLQKNQSQ